MKFSITNAHDFLALLVRRKWWVIVPFVALTGALTLLVTSLPKVFVSEALIRIRPRDVPGDIVRDLIGQSSEQRLRTIETTVLSKTNLMTILRDYGARMPEIARMNPEDGVLKVGSRIHFAFVGQGQGGTVPVTYFRIGYQDRDPELAQMIAKKLTSLFFDLDSKNKEDQVFGTTEFLDQELAKITTALDESETKLKGIKAKRLHELPANLEANLRALDRISAEKKANTDGVDRLTPFVMSLDQNILETPPMIPQPLPPPKPPRQPRKVAAKAPAPAPVPPPAPVIQPAPRNEGATMQQAQVQEIWKARVEAYRRAESEYESAKIGRTEKHPDVLSAKRNLDAAKAQVNPAILRMYEEAEKVAMNATLAPPPSTGTGMLVGREGVIQFQKPEPLQAIVPEPILEEEDEPEPPTPMMLNPVYKQLLEQRRSYTAELDIRAREKAQLDEDFKKYLSRVENTPGIEQELSSVLRENMDWRKQHDELSNKLAAAKLSASLENRQKGSQFQVVDPANLPLSPTKPSTPRATLTAALFSLLVSIALAVAIDVSRQRVWGPSEVEALWDVPVLVDIPEIVIDSEVATAGKKRRVQMGYALAMAAVYSVCLYGIYLNRGFIIEQLDPILERIVYR